MSQRPDPVPELLLEQLLLGELSPEDERRLRALLAPEEIEARLAALRSADAAFHEHAAAPARLANIRDRVRVERARRDRARTAASARRYWLPSLAVLGCIGLLLWRGPGPSQGGSTLLPAATDTTRVKGLAPHLVLYRRRGSEAETLSDGARARQGDMLQVGYVASEARYGVIVSIDGRGAVTLHFPDRETASTQLDLHGEHLLDHAYELDAAPGFERFFFITDQRPVDVKKVWVAAQALARTGEAARGARLALSPSLKQDSLTLAKE